MEEQLNTGQPRSRGGQDKTGLWYPLLPTGPCLLTVHLVMDLSVG